MKPYVVLPAKPTHFERFIVILMVRLGFHAAHLTWLRHYAALPDRIFEMVVRSLDFQSVMPIEAGMIIAPVPSLFRSSCPSAIIFRIRTIIVNAINPMGQRRALSNIGSEFGKIVSPFFSHSNTASTVVPEGLVLWIVATLLDCPPNAIQFRLGTAVSTLYLRY